MRETRALTWEDAVRKMTGLPANIVGMVDRGFLAPGMAADVTVFDPNAIADHATYEDPARPSDGIRDVVVNGRIALRNGAPTGERAGRALTRTEHMPSRPFLISLDKGATLIADKIERGVKSSTIPTYPWNVVSRILRILPTSQIAKMATRPTPWP